MKIIRILQPAVTEDIEITFPFYRVQHGRFYYYAIDKDNVISVTAEGDYPQIQCLMLIEGNVFHKESEYTTKEEFDLRFNKAVEVLTNLKNK
jgi:hypothetical protein